MVAAFCRYLFHVEDEMLTEIVMAVCLHTALACSDIAISFTDFPVRRSAASLYNSEVQAQAYMTNYGNLGIWFDEKYRDVDAGSTEALQLATHEVAHLIVFKLDPRASDHGSTFQRICRELSKKVGVNAQVTCRAEG